MKKVNKKTRIQAVILMLICIFFITQISGGMFETYAMSSEEFSTKTFTSIGSIENTSAVLQKQAKDNYVFNCTIPGEYYLDLKAPKGTDTPSVAGTGGAGAGITGRIELEEGDKLYFICTEGEEGCGKGAGGGAGLVAVYLNTVSENNLVCIAGGGGGGRMGGPYTYYILTQVSPWPNLKIDWVPKSGYLDPVNGGIGGKFVAEKSGGTIKWYDPENSIYVASSTGLVTGDMKGRSNSGLTSSVTVTTGKGGSSTIYSGNGGDGYYGGDFMNGGASFINKDILIDGYNLTYQNYSANPVIKLSMKQEKQVSNYTEIVKLIQKYAGGGIPTVTVQEDKAFKIKLPIYDDTVENARSVKTQIGEVNLTNEKKGDKVTEIEGVVYESGYHMMNFEGEEILFNVIESPSASNIKVQFGS